MLQIIVLFFFFKQKTAYEMRISDWSSDVCSSDLRKLLGRRLHQHLGRAEDRDRQLILGQTAFSEQVRCHRAIDGIGGIEPAMRDAMLHQQVAHRIDAAVHRRADDDRDGKDAMLAEFAPRRPYADERSEEIREGKEWGSPVKCRWV